LLFSIKYQNFFLKQMKRNEMKSNGNYDYGMNMKINIFSIEQSTKIFHFIYSIILFLRQNQSSRF